MTMINFCRTSIFFYLAVTYVCLIHIRVNFQLKVHQSFTKQFCYVLKIVNDFLLLVDT